MKVWGYLGKSWGCLGGWERLRKVWGYFGKVWGAGISRESLGAWGMSGESLVAWGMSGGLGMSGEIRGPVGVWWSGDV